LTGGCGRSCNKIMATDDHSRSRQATQTLFADWKARRRSCWRIRRSRFDRADGWRRAAQRFGAWPAPDRHHVDHGLRSEASREARDVKRLARTLDCRIARCAGVEQNRKPACRPLHGPRLSPADASGACAGATHILTAHTRDDQAETILMRMLPRSGIAGLAAMARSPSARVCCWRAVAGCLQSRLVATLKKAKIGFADDPTIAT